MIFRILSVGRYTNLLHNQIASRPYIIQKTFDFLNEFQRFCNDSKMQLTVLVIHAKSTSRGGLHEALTQGRPVGRLVVAHCRRMGIEVVDCLDCIDGYSATQESYHRDDPHLNRVGNQRAARALFDVALAGRLQR
jgi:hypothetical protein